jgi:hypothetical protein
MADDRLPVMLQFLRISIDPSGELAVGDNGPVGGGVASRECRSILRDSRGRTYLLFEHRAASRATSLGVRRRRLRPRTVLIASLWATTVAGAIAATIHWGIPVAPF